MHDSFADTPEVGTVTISPLSMLAFKFAHEREQDSIEQVEAVMGRPLTPINDAEPVTQDTDWDFARSALLTLLEAGALKDEWAARVRHDLGLDHQFPDIR